MMKTAMSGRDWVSYVDPLIGSVGEGNTFPGACAPFGMVQPSPDTGKKPFRCSGYAYEDEEIRGFSQTHLNGTGTPAYGDILLQPFVGDAGVSEGRVVFPSTYDRASQVCSPDCYEVVLRDFGVRVQATASEHVAWYRFTYPREGKARLLVDSASAQLMPWKQKGGPWIPESGMDFSSDGKEISGWRRVKGWVDAMVYFVVRLDRAPVSRTMLKRNAFEGAGDRVVLDFEGLEGETLGVQVALSTVSVAGARLNLLTETAGATFETVRGACRAAWNELLSRYDVVEGSEALRRRIYTAMYHLCIQPNNIADVDGRVRGADGQVRKTRCGRYYSTLSMWDTFRAAHPLYTLLVPERVDGFMETLMSHGEAFGLLPIWALWGKEGWSMPGVHSIPILVDAWCKGNRSFDGDEALRLMVQSLTTPRPDFPRLSWDVMWEHGYLPYDKGPHDVGFVPGASVSRTMEFAYDWWCVEKMARDLGNTATAEMAHPWAECWKKLFDERIGFMRAKNHKGEWREPFDPAENAQAGEFWGDYTEGSAWVYLWHVLHDPLGLAQLLGGNEAAVKKLDEFFGFEYESKSYWGDKTGTIGMYWHGNEPSHHIAYLYTLYGRRDLCEGMVKKVCDEFYLDKRDGLCGNDDCGQMSAWYLFSMLGFYPVNPANEGYVWGAAQVPEVVIQLPEGKLLRVKRTAAENARVQRILFNGEEMQGASVSHEALLRGGELVFE